MARRKRKTNDSLEARYKDLSGRSSCDWFHLLPAELVGKHTSTSRSHGSCALRSPGRVVYLQDSHPQEGSGWCYALEEGSPLDRSLPCNHPLRRAAATTLKGGFTYDELNRIKIAASQATTGQYCLGELPK